MIMMYEGGFNTASAPARKQKPLLFPHVEIPEPSSKDLRWQNKFDRFVAKGNSEKCAVMLRRAANNCQYWQVAHALLTRHAAKDPDSVFSLDSYAGTSDDTCNPVLSSQIWINGNTAIREMMVRALKPRHDPKLRFWGAVGDIRSFKIDTLMEWLPHVEGQELKKQIFLGVIARGNAENITAVIKSGAELNFEKSKPLQIAIGRKDPEIVQHLIDHGVNIFADFDAFIELAHKQGSLDIVKTLQDSRALQEKNAGLLPATTTSATENSSGWVAIGENFVEFTRPASPDGSQLKYQFDFETSFVTFIYEKNGTPAAPTVLSFAKLDRPALLDKAVKTLTNNGYPAPDLTPHLNPPVKPWPKKLGPPRP